MLTAQSPSRTLTTLQKGLTQGLHIGAQLFALLDGAPAADITLGLARLAADSPDPPDLPSPPSTTTPQ